MQPNKAFLLLSVLRRESMISMSETPGNLIHMDINEIGA